MSAYKHLPIPDMERWTPEQILAVYDLCQTISSALMERHEDQLVEQMIALDHRREMNPLELDIDENQYTLFE